MEIEKQLIERSDGKCELSKVKNNLIVYLVPPGKDNDLNNYIYISEKCLNQIEGKEKLDPIFWSFLKDSMWSDIPAVQVVSWRMLNRFRLRNETWALEALEMLYLNDDLLEWAKMTGDHEEESEEALHKDCNGVILKSGDSVVLTKSLDVKGSSVNAKIGTSVKNIRLVADNSDQIEGKIDGQLIVILTKYLRKIS